MSARYVGHGEQRGEKPIKFNLKVLPWKRWEVILLDALFAAAILLGKETHSCLLL